jgi:hypothetical protein
VLTVPHGGDRASLLYFSFYLLSIRGARLTAAILTIDATQKWSGQIIAMRKEDMSRDCEKCSRFLQKLGNTLMLVRKCSDIFSGYFFRSAESFA